MLPVQRLGDEQGNQISFHFLQGIRVILQRLIKIAIVFRAIDTEIVTDFMPQRAIKIAVGCQGFRLFVADGSSEDIL